MQITLNVPDNIPVERVQQVIDDVSVTGDKDFGDAQTLIQAEIMTVTEFKSVFME
ncbi:MAG: hypothetical protein ACRESZ_11055 [Methylococcales bacterium]